jgi:bis(5'-nucleosyl)-tetraphosphatase (symmetrical)
MAIYAIGDIQGCYDELIELLNLIQFVPEHDQLWLTGDLINRGPKSLEVLRLIKSLGDACITVLGNHDLHLLTVASGAEGLQRGDTLQPILNAPDKTELCDWLRQQKLLHYDADKNYLLVHAGVAPQWTLTQSINHANELEQALRSDNYADYLAHLYGKQPDQWNENLTGYDRLRCICNYLTRMRFCYRDGRLDFKFKGTVDNHPDTLFPWFDLPLALPESTTILFGHWAALRGVTHNERTICLDTGCVWGERLTALRLDDKKYFSVASRYRYEA